MQCRKTSQAEWGARALLSVGGVGRPGEVTSSRDLKGVREGRKPMSRGGTAGGGPSRAGAGAGACRAGEQL